MASSETKEHKSYSLFCNNTECETQMWCELPDKEGFHRNSLFICACLRLSMDGTGDSKESTAIEAAKKYLNDSNRNPGGPDTIDNIRIVNCKLLGYGYKCFTSYGCGIQTHCIGCCGDSSSSIRAEKKRNEEKKEINQVKTKSDSIFCNVTSCPARLWCRISDDAYLFICSCFELDSKKDERTEEIARLMWSDFIPDDMDDDENLPDSKETIRLVNCNDEGLGYKCGVRYGDGIHVHCTGCFGSLTKILRDELKK